MCKKEGYTIFKLFEDGKMVTVNVDIKSIFIVYKEDETYSCFKTDTGEQYIINELFDVISKGGYII